MRRFLLDSNALSDFVHSEGTVRMRVQQERRSGAYIGTGMPVVAEILAGAKYSATPESNLKLIRRTLNKIRLWPFDENAAEVYSQLYADMRRAGIQMQVIDRMIAAIALVVPNCTVVTTDSDFSRVPGLKVENWAS